MKKYILVHDIDTTGNRATLYDSDGQRVGAAYAAYETFYFNHNWAEQNPEDWWEAVIKTTREVIAITHVQPAEIACISFSSQMQGCLPVDAGGRPLHRMIIWADQRSTKEEQFFVSRLGQEKVYRITGHRASATYSGEKILWLKNNEPDRYRETHCFLQAKDYIIFKITGKLITDYSNASGMNLLDIDRLEWSPEILDTAGIDADKLPELHFSTDIVGVVHTKAAEELGLKSGIPVVAGGGNGASAAVGAGIVKEGSAYNYLGSSSWIGIATKEPLYDPEWRVFNWVHLVPRMYSPNGTMQSAVGSLDWFKNNICQLECLIARETGFSSTDLIDNKAIASQPGARGMVYLPYLIGERSPYWNPQARGAFVGLSMDSTKEDICRAVLEGVAFNLKLILDVFSEKVPIQEIRSIGGGAKSDAWRQIFADIFEKPIAKPASFDQATSLGAAIAGGVGVGLFKDFTVVEKLITIESTAEPRPENKRVYDKLYKVFKDSYRQLLPIYEQLAEL